MRGFVIILSLAALTAPAVASAEQTEITVRVLAKDSKFVGTRHRRISDFRERRPKWICAPM